MKTARFLATVLLLLIPATAARAQQGTMRLSPADACTMILTSGRPPRAGLQFDDGYINHYTRARPVLMRYGLVGSFGIITGDTDFYPDAMTSYMLSQMVVLGYQFQDHTRTHNALEWGDPLYASQWGPDIVFSQEVFANVSMSLWPMSAWNQPGGPGEGFTDRLRDTLKAYGYDRAAGRVGLTAAQTMNFHYGLVDDPFSLGRGGVYSWTYNAPAAALEKAGIDPFSPEGQRLLEVMSAEITHDSNRMAALMPQCGPEGASLAHGIAVTWTWQAEVAVILTKMADAVAQGLFPIPAFHWIDDDAEAGLDAICLWLVSQDIAVMGFDDLVRLAEVPRSLYYGMEFAAPLGVDRDGNERTDGWNCLSISGDATNGAGTTVFGTPPGTLLVRATISEPLQPTYADEFYVFYEKTSIDPVTFAYANIQEFRAHTLIPNEVLSFVDTLEIDQHIDRVRMWFAGISTEPFTIESFSVIPTADPTAVDSHPPRSTLAIEVSPNPSNGIANIAFHLDTPTRTEVAVYSVDGRLVERLIDAEVSGNVELSWRHNGVPSGIYLITVVAGQRHAAKKIIVVK